MNVSQANLYEILDCLQINAIVGESGITVKNKIQIVNKNMTVEAKLIGVFIFETKTSMWVLVRLGDLGMLIKANSAILRTITLVDLADDTVTEYMKSKDYKAFLTHTTTMKDIPWVKDIIKC